VHHTFPALQRTRQPACIGDAFLALRVADNMTFGAAQDAVAEADDVQTHGTPRRSRAQPSGKSRKEKRCWNDSWLRSLGETCGAIMTTERIYIFTFLFLVHFDA